MQHLGSSGTFSECSTASVSLASGVWPPVGSSGTFNVLRLCEVGDLTHKSRLEALMFNLSTKV